MLNADRDFGLDGLNLHDAGAQGPYARFRGVACIERSFAGRDGSEVPFARASEQVVGSAPHGGRTHSRVDRYEVRWLARVHPAKLLLTNLLSTPARMFRPAPLLSWRRSGFYPSTQIRRFV